MRRPIAIAVYYLAIGMIVVFAGVIVVKLMFWPPCTTAGKECVVDGWSVAGLAATVLGISATVLALLGTLAIATWWAGLDDRVAQHLRKSLDKHEEEMKKSLQTLNKGFAKFMVDLILSLPPWLIDEWAVNAVSTTQSIDIAKLMLFSYLEFVDKFVSSGTSVNNEHLAHLTQLKAPSLELLYYWDAVLRWQKIVEQYKQQEPDLVKQVDEKIESYKLRVEAWKQ